MSTYQYYEFQAIDRPLTAKEMSELRTYSSRARISPTSFVVDYAWGSFKGDEEAWMEKYFDAHLYLANWGTRVLKLRLPSRLLDAEAAKACCGGGSAVVRMKSGKAILTFVSEDEGGGEWIDGEGHLLSLMSVRAELARGDLRALYLGWLLRAQTGELDDDDAEPPVPPGLGRLSGSLESLAEFMRIDEDLLHVAAEASPPMVEAGLDRNEVRRWVGKLPAKEKDVLITNLMVGADQAHIAELLQRFLKEQAGTGGTKTTGRTVSQLLRAAEDYTVERERLEAKKRAKEKARREREAALVRRKHLDSLAGSEVKLWAEVEGLVSTKQPKNYDQAVRILVDLRDLAARGKGGDFRLRIEVLRQNHARKPSFIERLRKVGL